MRILLEIVENILHKWLADVKFQAKDIEEFSAKASKDLERYKKEVSIMVQSTERDGSWE